VICNHRSWLDVAMLVYATDSIGISKKEISYIPFIGQAGWIVGAIYFDRKDRSSRAKVVEEALDMMSKGANIHLFPEGTRTRNGRLSAKVHLRLVEAAWARGIPVVPACTWKTEKSLPAEKLWAWPGSPGLEVGPPLLPAHFADAASFGKAAWEKVVELARLHESDQEWA
jgi:1-acyl-sn-glycerol-3-phosphate acyltransferase